MLLLADAPNGNPAAAQATARVRIVGEQSKRHATRGACERESRSLVGKHAVAVSKRFDHKKVFNVVPRYPDLPKDTVGRGGWVGELLVSETGNVVRVWTLREPDLTPLFPAFTKAITDAVSRWRFQPVHLNGETVPVCMTVTLTIDWQ